MIERNNKANKKNSFEFKKREIFRKFFKNPKKYTPLTIEEEVEVIKKIQSGHEDYCNILFEKNILFVFHVLKSINIRHGFISFEDVLLLGVEGLWNAVRKVSGGVYDLSKGFRFTTYAVHYIKGSVQVGLKNYSPLINRAASLNKNFFDFKKIQERVFVETGEWDSLLSNDFLDNIPKEDSIFIQKEIASLDEIVGVSIVDYETFVTKDVYIEALNVEKNFDPERVFLEEDFYTVLRAIFSSLLSLTEQEVLVYSFGLYKVWEAPYSEKQLYFLSEGRLNYSNQEIAEIMGKCSQTICNIRGDALKKMRGILSRNESLNSNDFFHFFISDNIPEVRKSLNGRALLEDFISESFSETLPSW